MIYLIAVLSFSLLSNSIHCQTLNDDIDFITTNPLETLQNFESKLAEQGPLSLEECESLIQKLETVKKQLCTRPGAGLNSSAYSNH